MKFMDGLIGLVKPLNTLICYSIIDGTKINNKRTLDSFSFSSQALAKKPFVKEELNYLVDLEKGARQNFGNILKESLEDLFKTKLSDGQCQDLILNRMTCPTHNHGEISTPCFPFTKLFPNKNSKQIATSLAVAINTKTKSEKSNLIETVEAIDGHINVYLQPFFLGQIMPLILDESNSFMSKLPDHGEKMIIEYSQPNTHQAFHVGHLWNVALGECLWRLFDLIRYKVIPVNYFDDERAYVAKCLWLLNKIVADKKINLDDINPEERGE